MGDRGVMRSGQQVKAAATDGFVTVRTGGQLFGFRLECVRDVFVPRGLTKVPLAPPEVAGVLNLRGRILTAIDLRARLGLPARDADAPFAVGIEQRGELYGILVDGVGEVLHLERAALEATPVNLDGRWARLSAGVHRLKADLLVVLDVDKVLELDQGRAAA